MRNKYNVVINSLGIHDAGNIEILPVTCYRLNVDHDDGGKHSLFSIGKKDCKANQAFTPQMMDTLNFSSKRTS